ncbi:septum formation protein [Fodinibius salinus]|uniref:dTTP/UTP pyrophosphatase n=1 Tax=Fodinibius salinus TaxID=860790 RepID=A0A5D3YPL8_9BACT|nr:Maf family protein [Fodinibius salinus]TYP94983.1 septum formation protein [Fodinibius salinus]
MQYIILASGSPRRKQLLEHINLEFQVHPSSVGEAYSSGLSGRDVVRLLSMRKAKDVAPSFKESLIIGADTVVVFEDAILEKPEDADEATAMLNRLSNNTHQVITGVALCQTGTNNNITNTTTFAEITDVTFGNIDSAYLDSYVSSGAPLDKAGGYGIQDDFGALFVKKISGSYYNVVGFPLHSFYTEMKSFAPGVLPNLEVDS